MRAAFREALPVLIAFLLMLLTGILCKSAVETHPPRQENRQ
jgi:hypothetical protein